MKNERWFIAFRYIEKDFLSGRIDNAAYGSVVTDVTPARWVMYRTIGSGMETHILYAEQISLAMASELVHSGTNIMGDYYKDADDQ